MNTHTNYLRWFAALTEHLTAFDLPAGIASVQITEYPAGRQGHLTVQLDPATLPVLAAGLLAWADTITHIRASAWRPPSGDRVHLNLHGQIADGVSACMFGAVAYVESIFGPGLEPCGEQSVSLGMLRHWASLAAPGAVAA
jgi:hypothetical protein